MIDVQESTPYLSLLEKVERSKKALDHLKTYSTTTYEDSYIDDLEKTIDELIKRNIQAYQLIINFSRIDNQILIGNSELELYKELATKFPEYQKYFIR